MSVKNESGGVIVVYFKALTWNLSREKWRQQREA